MKYWVGVEGDEASFTKSNMLGVDPEADPKKPVRWEQWLGLVQRGRPESLILERLNPPPSEVRAPGPGAVRKVEWLPLAKKHVQGNHIIFHTDAARSYTAKVDQVLHDNVVHAKKRKVIDGKVTWIKPNYVTVVSHKLPGTSKTVRVKAGTQIIDRARRYMKDRIVLNQTLGTMFVGLVFSVFICMTHISALPQTPYEIPGTSEPDPSFCVPKSRQPNASIGSRTRTLGRKPVIS